MAIVGFTGAGYIGDFLSLSALNTQYPANLYAGRQATITTGGTATTYVSDGVIWTPITGGGDYNATGLQSSRAYDATKAAANWAILDSLSQQVAAAGGGTINLPPYGIPISQALIPRSGVNYLGMQPKFFYGNGITVPDPYTVPTGGTVLIGDAVMNGATGAVTSAGTFDGYAANTTALGSPASNFADLGFTSCGMVDVTFYGFRSAISIGATNNPGVWYSKFIVHAINCTDFAYKFENFLECTFEFMHSSGCVHGQRYRNSASVLNCGNSTFGQIYNQPRTGYTTFDRGIVFECTNGVELNELFINRLQTNSNGSRVGRSSQVVTNAATLGGGTTLTVADGTKFEVGLPVWLSFNNTTDFRAYEFNVNQGTVFWVASVSGGNITVSKTYGDSLNNTNLQTFTNGTAGRLYLNTLGYAGLELNGLSGGAIPNAQILQIDLELECTVAIQMQNCTGNQLHWFNMPPSSGTIPPTLPSCHVSLAGRGGSQNLIFSSSLTNFDLDNQYWTWYGARVNYDDNAAGIGNTPAGIQTSSIWLNGAYNDTNPDFNGTNGGVKSKGGLFAPAQTFTSSGSAVFGSNTLAGSTAAQTITLPTPNSATVGADCVVTNNSTVAWSVVIQSGLLFNGKAALTTITLNSKAAATFKATYDGSVYGYGIVGCTAAYAAGTITGV